MDLASHHTLPKALHARSTFSSVSRAVFLSLNHPCALAPVTHASQPLQHAPGQKACQNSPRQLHRLLLPMRRQQCAQLTPCSRPPASHNTVAPLVLPSPSTLPLTLRVAHALHGHRPLPQRAVPCAARPHARYAVPCADRPVQRSLAAHQHRHTGAVAVRCVRGCAPGPRGAPVLPPHSQRAAQAPPGTLCRRRHASRAENYAVLRKSARRRVSHRVGQTLGALVDSPYMSRASHRHPPLTPFCHTSPTPAPTPAAARPCTLAEHSTTPPDPPPGGMLCRLSMPRMRAPRTADV